MLVNGFAFLRVGVLLGEQGMGNIALDMIDLVGLQQMGR
jgi:hypothetical protein